MTNHDHVDEEILSQLADGELANDQFVDVLLGVLDDPQARQTAKAHLELRKALGEWRRQAPARPLVAAPPRKSFRVRSVGRQAASLAAAAVIAGLLVTLGFLAARHSGTPSSGGDAAAVTRTQMADIARAFQLHESVAGPLQWYADDDSGIRFASEPRPAGAGKPVAVVLSLDPGGGPDTRPRRYVVVCRSNQSATIELPESGGMTKARLHVAPLVRDGQVSVEYAIALWGAGPGAENPAVLAGERTVRLASTSLGEMPLGEQWVRVRASAWILGGETSP
jgi:hypothetical protein